MMKCKSNNKIIKTLTINKIKFNEKSIKKKRYI